MASFTAGTTFVDGVSNDVTAAKLGALVTNATPTSGFIQDRTAETITATNDTLLIGDASDSNNLKRITVANFAQTLPTAKMTTGTIDTGTFGTTTSTAATITALTAGTTTSTNEVVTNGTITNLSATTSTFLGTITGSTNVINIGSGQIYKDASGNVGVGTSSPAAIGKLVVSGSVVSNAATTSYDQSGIQLSYDSNVGVISSSNASGGAISFRTNPAAGFTAERLRIDASGNVGIGIASPAAKLDVSGGNIVNTTTATGTTGLSLSNGTAGAGLSCDFSASNTYLDIKSKLFIRDSASAFAARMNIDASGNVGIGVASPTTKLDVDGGITLRAVGGEGGQINILNPTNASTGLEIDISTANTGRIFCTNNNSVLQLGQLAGTGGIVSLYTAATERLRIDSNGNVGIGVEAPVNKLEVVGSFGRGAPVTKTADFTLADTENWLIVNKGSSCTVTLPAASSWTGREFTIKVITAHAVVSATAASVVPRIGGGAGTAILPATDGAWATLVSNGATWEIMCGS